MKKKGAIMAERLVAFTRETICKGIFAILFLVFSGCATAPLQPVPIRHEKATPRGDAAMPVREHRKEPADQNTAELVALLKSKNIISTEEAARLAGQPLSPGAEEKKTSPGKIKTEEATASAPEWSERVRFGGDIRLRSESDRWKKEPGTFVQSAGPGATEQERAPSGNGAAMSDPPHRKGTSDQGIAALVDLLKSKNVLSDEEASRLRAQSMSTAREKGAAVTSEANEQQRIEMIAARAIELVMINIQEQVKRQVREELAKEMKEHEKERIETITASVTDAIKKSLPEQVKSEVRTELPGEMRDKEKGEKTTTGFTEEQKKDLQEEVKSQVKEELASKVKEGGLFEAAWEWTKQHVRFDGDVRLRYQGDFYDENNADLLKPSNPTELLNTTENRNRFQLRARAGVTVQVTDEVEAGLRISTGSTSNPVSENVTLGDYENNESIVLDRAYIRLKPWPKFSFWGGRIPNPFFYTDMVWDNDLNFDGIGLNYTLGVHDRFTLFLNALASPVEEVEFSSHDKWLFGGQLGFQHKPWTDVTYRIAGAYYDYRNITGEANDPLKPGEKDYTAPKFQQKGNTLFDIDPSAALKLALASEYRLINITGDIQIGFWKPVYVTFLGDYVKNIGFDRHDVARNTGNPNVKEETYGYQVGLSVGHKRIQKFGDWEIFSFYKYLKADAVLDAFTDSDFHAGGTNAKGWGLGGSLGLFKNTWLTLRWLTTDAISGPPLAIDTLQMDLNVRF